MRKNSSALKDIYYCPHSVRSFKEIEMNDVGSFSLRLRRGSKTGHNGAELNIKVITQRGDHHSWREHETMVDSFSETQSILLAIGFKAFFTLEKKRTVYKKGNITLCIEDIKNSRPCLELEVLTTRSSQDSAKASLLEILQQLDIPRSAIVPKSITNILMRRQAKF